MRKRTLFNVALLVCVALVVTVATYSFNVWLLSSNEWVSPTDALFIEGVLSLLFGVMFLLGRGGLNAWSVRAAILAATASAVSGKDTVGPREMLQRDAWRAKGFARLGLVLLLAGGFMLAAYFLTL